MTLADQYHAIFKIVFDRGFREKYFASPKRTLKEFGLTESEAGPLTMGNVGGLTHGAQAERIKFLGLFNARFPKSLAAWVSCFQNIDPVDEFLASKEFSECFTTDDNFISAFERFFGKLIEDSGKEGAVVLDLYKYERALAAVTKDRRAEDKTAMEEIAPTKVGLSSRYLVRGSEGRLELFQYSIFDLAEYLHHFISGNWFKLSPLLVMAGQSPPRLLIPHHPLPEPMAVLFLPGEKEPRILKIRRLQYEAIWACDGNRSLEETACQLSDNADNYGLLTRWLTFCVRTVSFSLIKLLLGYISHVGK